LRQIGRQFVRLKRFHRHLQRLTLDTPRLTAPLVWSTHADNVSFIPAGDVNGLRYAATLRNDTLNDQARSRSLERSGRLRQCGAELFDDRHLLQRERARKNCRL